MVKTSNISRLTDKFLEGKLTSKESAELDSLLLEKDNVVFFKNMVKDDYLYQRISEDSSMEANLLKIMKDIERSDKMKRKFPKRIFKYAAVLVFALSVISIWYFNGNTKQVESTNLVKVIEKDVQLILGNGQKQFIKSNEHDTIQNGTNDVIGYLADNTLRYFNHKNDVLSYNTLVVPYGKTFHITLSDGTEVDLNAGTTFKYPVNFIANEPREVFLTGEAYFDVTHNENDRFIVNANNVNIEVLGTEFNVSSYKDGLTTEAVLIEGSVRFYDKLNEDNQVLLKPNDYASWDKNLNTISKTTVNTIHHTSWRNSELIFRSTSFNNIAKKLERHFNVSITGIDKTLENEKFTARFKDKTIDQILLYFSESYGFSYQVEGNKISIK
ncbi:FecR family protein [uncultured Algibacter sp.]|uniref:FecR family protein n=1 Tax=uncultured Algibacter sp. TaxID=298659 RepID=UPI003216DA21